MCNYCENTASASARRCLTGAGPAASSAAKRAAVRRCRLERASEAARSSASVTWPRETYFSAQFVQTPLF